jgi:hypothetical protein
MNLIRVLFLAVMTVANVHIARLGDDDFDTRERASADLRHMGPLALSALKKAAKTSKDAEIRRRAADLIAPLTLKRLEWWMSANGYTDWPFVDSLPNERVGGWEMYCKLVMGYRDNAIEQGFTWSNPDYRADREGGRRYFQDRIAAGDTDDELIDLLKETFENELKRVKSFKWTWVGPPALLKKDKP